MASVFNVARYVLNHVGSMTAMKLEKLVYYCQAWSLAGDGVPLFDEDYEVWVNRPVCQTLFQFSQGQFWVSAKEMQGSSDALNEEQKETIQAVLDYYGDKDAQWLSRLTHMEDPWKEARRGTPTGMLSHQIITKESMAMYYGGI